MGCENGGYGAMHVYRYTVSSYVVWCNVTTVCVEWLRRLISGYDIART